MQPTDPLCDSKSSANNNNNTRRKSKAKQGDYRGIVAQSRVVGIKIPSLGLACVMGGRGWCWLCGLAALGAQCGIISASAAPTFVLSSQGPQGCL